MSADEFGVLSEAIRNREVIGSNLVSNVGFLNSPDALSWSAEELLDLEGVATTVVFGVSDDMIHIAGQSRDARVNLADVLEEAFADEADTVGHSDEARASVPLGIFRTVGEEQEGDEEREVLIELVDETVKTKLFEAMNVDEED
jgi:nanoRNase/pAp phosphatase (c-di-AMP/oligoRNAs hydrolase)